MGYCRKDKRGDRSDRRRERRHRKLLDDLKETRGYSHLKEEALDGTKWRACFGRGFGPVVRLLNEIHTTSDSIIQVTIDHTKNVTVKHTLSDHQKYIKYIMLNPPCDTHLYRVNRMCINHIQQCTQFCFNNPVLSDFNST